MCNQRENHKLEIQMAEFYEMLLEKKGFIFSFLLLLLLQLASLNDSTETSTALLSIPEAKALQKVLKELGINRNISRYYCVPTYKDADFTISCGCDYKTNCTVSHITKLTLQGNLKTGKIHPSLGKLSFLEELDLSSNSLSGQIPKELGDLSNIKTINLAGNLLTGTIPSSLGNLSSLEELVLISNSLSGQIPKALGDLSNLKTINLARNFLTGSIPSSLGNLSSLEELYFSFNLLSGQIPKTLGNLSNLESMYLNENSLTGHLPPELGSLGLMSEFYVSANNLSGELPGSYGNLTSLQYFAVAGNNFGGRIPSFFGSWTNLYELNLEGNEFEGWLPPEIFYMSNLVCLSVTDVRNSGFSFPKYANMSNLYWLILRNCSISGQIPGYVGNWPNLAYIDLSFNNLVGKVPETLKNKHLSRLYLTGNMLNGSIPPWITNAVGFEVDLTFNNFSNPSDNFTKHNRLELHTIPDRNYLHGMKDKHCKHKALHHDLFINSGGEEVPIAGKHYESDNTTSKYYEKPGKWAYSCSGDFGDLLSYSKASILNTSSLVCETEEGPLYKSSRYCPISLYYYGFCLRKGHYNLTLHFIESMFTHTILGKRVFDVYVQGEKKLPDFNIKEKAGSPNKEHKEYFTTYVNDTLLLEILFYWAGKGSAVELDPGPGPLISAITLTPIPGKKLSPAEIAGITVGCIVLAPLLVLAFIWKMGWLENKELYDVHIEVADGRSFTLKQIIVATRNFSPKTEIGRGRYGMVYKAELPDGIKLAVKKISPEMKKQEKDELLREIFNLKSLRHENLVQLLDGYSNKGLHLLAYEYTENGSLYQVLFDPNKTTKLDWRMRFDICMGIAKGLKYLHEEKRFDIVHGNITAKNILLDKSFTAKISDFGLASLCREEDPFMSIIKARAARIYMAPEYARGEAITVKADIYSYGVVLLEIVSGRTNAVYNPNQEADFLLDTAWVLHNKGRILELVDKDLGNCYDRKQAITMLNLAIMCINQSATLRPTISQVVGVLSGDITTEDISKVNENPSA